MSVSKPDIFLGLLSQCSLDGSDPIRKSDPLLPFLFRNLDSEIRFNLAPDIDEGPAIQSFGRVDAGIFFYVPVFELGKVFLDDSDGFLFNLFVLPHDYSPSSN